MKEKSKKGVLLVNLGTPEAPTAAAVRAFLSEFLHDHRVVDLSRWLWCPILHGVILPIRAPKVAKLYQSVWMNDGSPLMVYSRRQQSALAEQLDCPVALAMTYGNPSIDNGINHLQQQGCEEIIVLPLYPQYSGTTTAAVFDRVAKAVKKTPHIPAFHFINDYYNHPAYIEALAQSIRDHWDKNGRSDYLLCSYHGIPQRLADAGDPYPLQCEETTRLLAKALDLNDDQIGHSYQSRFGREPWLMPYTDKTLEQLPKNGVKSLDIITPAFSADCLETLEEIAEQCRDSYLEAGGVSFNYIPCLNDNTVHIEALKVILSPAISS
ncbi:ferrochelatase [Vibrio sp. SS-MA-C1-2]|uniref:ferrochelatase n=1 Tax=Vibrio sp. SS-MA-C1-2 TaxID=2908646 RepID=UPI001F45CBB4|nr:ferrochelatase [Vibrio sp. SS-MA-C1-2]UJF20177.1 ferrochelatase [Vibrio sp. SS-MA-C1-2]